MCVEKACLSSWTIELFKKLLIRLASSLRVLSLASTHPHTFTAGHQILQKQTATTGATCVAVTVTPNLPPPPTRTHARKRKLKTRAGPVLCSAAGGLKQGLCQSASGRFPTAPHEVVCVGRGPIFVLEFFSLDLICLIFYLTFGYFSRGYNLSLMRALSRFPLIEKPSRLNSCACARGNKLSVGPFCLRLSTHNLVYRQTIRQMGSYQSVMCGSHNHIVLSFYHS